MTRNEIIKEIIRLGNELLKEEKVIENSEEDDYEPVHTIINSNQCPSSKKGYKCHKLADHWGQHHDIIMGIYWE